MRRRVLWAVLGTLCLAHAGCGGASPADSPQVEQPDYRAELRSALQTLSDPTYFVVGTSDGLLDVDQLAHTLLQNAGNPNLAFVTFPGGHDHRQSDVEEMYLWMRRFEKKAHRS